MENAEPDLYHNDGTFLYVKRDGKFYRRVGGKGWERMTTEPDTTGWPKLQPAQWSAFRSAFKDAGLND